VWLRWSAHEGQHPRALPIPGASQWLAGQRLAVHPHVSACQRLASSAGQRACVRSRKRPAWQRLPARLHSCTRQRPAWQRLPAPHPGSTKQRRAARAAAPCRVVCLLRAWRAALLHLHLPVFHPLLQHFFHRRATGVKQRACKAHRRTPHHVRVHGNPSLSDRQLAALGTLTTAHKALEGPRTSRSCAQEPR
jgi:hypothetical protein